VAFVVAVLLAVSAVAAAVALSRSGVSSRAVASTSQSNGAPLVLSGTDPVTGRQVSLAAFAGKPVVVNMWASWCTGCIAEARAQAVFERAHPEAQVIGLDVQDSKSGARAFYRRFGWRHPSIFDPNGALAARLGLQGLPTTIFLDRRHRIVARILGETNVAGFTNGLRKAARACC
jgi:thiol-disulfide isomerase/thioredoxin